MAEYKVFVSFSGLISGAVGQKIEIDNKSIEKDLLNAGYIEAVKKNKAAETTADKTDENEV